MEKQQNLASEVAIREYTVKDVPQLKECLLVLQDYVHILEPQLIATGKEVYDSYLEHLLNEINKNAGKIFVAEAAGKLIGFISFYFNKEAYESTKTLYISDLVVLEEYRGMGLGTKLLKYADDYAKTKDCKFIKISALAKNLNAINLYRKMGFVDYGISLLKIL